VVSGNFIETYMGKSMDIFFDVFTNYIFTSRHMILASISWITKVRKESSGSPAGSCQQCKIFGNLLFPGDCHTILQLAPQMKHLVCFYSSTASPQQETRNHEI